MSYIIHEHIFPRKSFISFKEDIYLLSVYFKLGMLSLLAGNYILWVWYKMGHWNLKFKLDKKVVPQSM